jgi:hypothetical protein
MWISFPDMVHDADEEDETSATAKGDVDQQEKDEDEEGDAKEEVAEEMDFYAAGAEEEED